MRKLLCLITYVDARESSLGQTRDWEKGSGSSLVTLSCPAMSGRAAFAGGVFASGRV